MLANEKTSELVNPISKLFLQRWELSEIKVLSTPEKHLFGELILLLEIQPLSDVVITLYSLDFAPKNDLIKSGGLSQFEQGKLQFHPILLVYMHIKWLLFLKVKRFADLVDEL